MVLALTSEGKKEKRLEYVLLLAVMASEWTSGLKSELQLGRAWGDVSLLVAMVSEDELLLLVMASA
jgi:hypothetical protein